MFNLEFAWPDAVGLVGVVLLLVSYFLLQIGKLNGQGIVYSVLNGLAAILIIVSLLHTFNLASFIIEIFWLAISLIGIRRWWKQRRGADSKSI